METKGFQCTVRHAAKHSSTIRESQVKGKRNALRYSQKSKRKKSNNTESKLNKQKLRVNERPVIDTLKFAAQRGNNSTLRFGRHLHPPFCLFRSILFSVSHLSNQLLILLWRKLIHETRDVCRIISLPQTWKNQHHSPTRGWKTETSAMLSSVRGFFFFKEELLCKNIRSFVIVMRA